MLLVLPSSLLITDVIVGEQVPFCIADYHDDDDDDDDDDQDDDGDQDDDQDDDDLDDDHDDDDTQQAEQLTLGGEDYSSDYLDYLLGYQYQTFENTQWRNFK